ncbi:RraA family protein [Cohnella caldifontis]|uniref:RraA family protein n=1 Tax=Cohnella caldifontis TaxID=3027471 RepID=UPI0023EB62F2|nr:RraA family protein [Cohnella sp. YIM B05605]
MKYDNPEDIIQITPLWTGERFANGRPKVPDDILRRMRRITLEEAWSPIWRRGYDFQFQGGFQTVHPNMTVVGRAVTAVFAPERPDLNDALLKYGQEEEHRKGFFNQWVIDSLVEDDVVVVDMFDKVYKGTFVGGNLTTAISTRTKRGGAVVWGGMRDVQQVEKIANVNVYHRGIDPTPIRQVTMLGMNVPCRIGNAICLPGDVVMATPMGVLFIPPHLAELAVVLAEKSQVRDVFGFERLAEGKYTTADIDGDWPVALWEDFLHWFRTSDKAADYQSLAWEEELQEARERERSGEAPGNTPRA